MRPIRPAVFTDYQRGGVYVFTQRLCGELKANQDCEVHIITFSGSLPREQEAIERLTAVSHRLHFIARTSDPYRQMGEIAAILDNGHFDVFVPNYRSIAYAAATMSAAARRPRVVGICHDNHGSYYDLLGRYEQVTDVFVCPSPVTTERLKERLPHRAPDIRCIPHGVPAGTTGSAVYDGGPLRLAYNGRLDEDQKRVSCLLAIARNLADRSISFELILIGDGPDEGYYRRLTEQLELAERVTFCGYCEVDAAMKLTAASHLVLLTSRHEGFCYGVAEAMAQGLPAVVFSCGGVVEQFVRDGVNGYVVPWGDVPLASERISRFHNNPDRWKAFSDEARKEMEVNYGMKRFGAAYTALFSELMGQRRAMRRWPWMRPLMADHNLRTRIVEKAGLTFGLW